MNFKSSIQQTLKDLNIQSWNSKLLESNKGRNYNSIYKQEINFEYYIKAVNRSTYLPILRFRTGNHKFPVEKGRWESIPYHERKCQVCQKKKKKKKDVCDEFHYLFVCPLFGVE